MSTNLKKAVDRLAAQGRALASEELSPERKGELIERIKVLLKEKNAVLVSHYYVDGDLQDLAEETGGCVADSLDMAKFGLHHPARTVVVAGVRFMGETAKILSPDKRVLLVEPDANCSLDIGCPADEFAYFCDRYPDRTVVVYANTSVGVKARADWVVTSAIAVDVVKHLASQGNKILWAPDRYLGQYIEQQSGADMVMWDGSCIVHEEFKSAMLEDLKAQHPHAKVLVHPESPAAVLELADMVGSTSQILGAAKTMDADEFIVGTEDGILHQMKKALPHKTFITAPTAGRGATCISCAHCPWMKLNDLERLCRVLESGQNALIIDEKIRQKAAIALQRMVDFKARPVSGGSTLINDACEGA